MSPWMRASWNCREECFGWFNYIEELDREKRGSFQDFYNVVIGWIIIDMQATIHSKNLFLCDHDITALDVLQAIHNKEAKASL